ncbi:MAG: prepilin-type N-terminal cleavage/methylation domain-containing protein [Candidatus Omnitrophica bacterium]|nr:prepilin-type N-terminal cleavage/methylation domain-containing protein [Candidatus Omnitrophota bacterium]
MVPVAQKNKKGFTLSELLIAAAIFALAMAGILQLFISCAFLDQANRNKSIASTHAEFTMEDIMEYMRNNELSSLQSQINSGNWNWNSATICSKLGCGVCTYPSVLNSESIATTRFSSSTDPLDVMITVSWKDRPNASLRSLILKTEIAKRR